MAAHTQDVIDSVRQALIEGATFGEIGSRLGFTRATVNGIVARNGTIGLSQHFAKSRPIEANAQKNRPARFALGRFVSSQFNWSCQQARDGPDNRSSKKLPKDSNASPTLAMASHL
jgi:hypothetical protein